MRTQRHSPWRKPRPRWQRPRWLAPPTGGVSARGCVAPSCLPQLQGCGGAGALAGASVAAQGMAGLTLARISVSEPRSAWLAVLRFLVPRAVVRTTGAMGQAPHTLHTSRGRPGQQGALVRDPLCPLPHRGM